jgi:hypothetical protein
MGIVTVMRVKKMITMSLIVMGINAMEMPMTMGVRKLAMIFSTLVMPA